MNVKILEVIPPSEKQTQSNIHGTVNLMIEADNGTPVVRLSGITVRKDKSGNSFLSMPSYKVGTDKDAKYYNHFQLFPLINDNEEASSSQKDRLNALTQEVVRIVANGGTKRTNNTPTAKTAPVAASIPAKPISNNKSPWEI